MANYSEAAYIAATARVKLQNDRHRTQLSPIDLGEIVDLAVELLPSEGDWRRELSVACKRARDSHRRKMRCRPMTGCDLTIVIEESRPDTLPPCYIRLPKRTDSKRVALALSKGWTYSEIGDAIGVGKSMIAKHVGYLRSDLRIMDPRRGGPLTAYVQQLVRTGRIATR